MTFPNDRYQVIGVFADGISYDEVFAYPLRTMVEAGGVLITISSSDNSENVAHTCQWAKDNGVATKA